LFPQIKWKPVIGTKVKSWLNARLPIWIETQPVWFDDYWKSLIPDNMIEDKALILKIQSTTVKRMKDRRRSSMVLGSRGAELHTPSRIKPVISDIENF